MNPSIQGKLERLAERFTEITALMAEPEIQGDQARFRALGQEYAQLEPVARCFHGYQAIEEDLANAEAMLADPEMAGLAREEMDAARKKGELEHIAKCKQVEEVLREASAPPPELALVEELLGAPDEQTLKAKLEEHRKELTPEFMEVLTALIARTQSGEEQGINQRLQTIYGLALRMAMQANL